MVELHNNFTIDGSKATLDGVYPTNHAEHETVEITHGFNDWFECGFYIFTSITEGQSWQWVGDHIRPRVAVPKKWQNLTVRSPDPGNATLGDGRPPYVATCVLQEMPFVPECLNLDAPPTCLLLGSISSIWSKVIFV